MYQMALRLAGILGSLTLALFSFVDVAKADTGPRQASALSSMSELRSAWRDADFLKPDIAQGIIDIEGHAWRAPGVYQQTVERIRTRLNATGLIAIPEGAFVIGECLGYFAFPQPDGRITVCREAFRRATKEDALAFLYAHEAAHFALGHLEADSGPRLLAVAGVALWIGAAVSIGQDPTGSVARSLGQLAAMTLPGRANDSACAYLKSFSPQREIAADRVAVLLLTAAGYDPGIANDVLEETAATRASGRALSCGNELVATGRFHPAVEDRLNALDRLERTDAAFRNAREKNEARDLPWATANNTYHLENYARSWNLFEILWRDHIPTIAHLDAIKSGIGSMGGMSPALTRNEAISIKALMCRDINGILQNEFELTAEVDRLQVQMAAAALGLCDTLKAYNFMIRTPARFNRDGLAWHEDAMIFAMRTNIDEEIYQPHMGDAVERFGRRGLGQKRALALGVNAQRMFILNGVYAACQTEPSVTYKDCRGPYVVAVGQMRRLAPERQRWDDVLLTVQSPTTILFMSLQEDGIDRARRAVTPSTGALQMVQNYRRTLPPSARAPENESRDIGNAVKR